MTRQGFLPSRLRIGTRGSPLALYQAQHVRDRLAAAHPGLPASAIEIVEIRTSGDRIQDRPLADAGGKGLFTKEIEEALYTGSIDIAVHSMKDMPTALPLGLVIPCLLPREDPRDAFLSLRFASPAALPPGTVVGTSSLRRKAQLLHRRPDLAIIDFRGNVQTRLRKLEDGIAAATLLALAGLRRLNMADRATAILEVDELLPAVAQGAIGVECRADDDVAHRLLAPLADVPTTQCVDAERALLAVLDGSCRTPIAALAVPQGDDIALSALIVSPDGQTLHRTERRGLARDAARLGRDAGDELRRRGGPHFFLA